MRELLVCDGCGHQAAGVKDLLVLDSFAFAGAGATPIRRATSTSCSWNAGAATAPSFPSPPERSPDFPPDVMERAPARG
jgi:hypothetical protein